MTNHLLINIIRNNFLNNLFKKNNSKIDLEDLIKRRKIMILFILIFY